MSVKLFIPGPIAVSPSTYEAMSRPLIGHRSADFVNLYQSMQPRLQTLFGTSDPVYLSTSSAWGVMEGAVNNVCQRKVLNCMCGAFSDKWNDVSMRGGHQAGALRVDWGQPIEPEALENALKADAYDAVTIIHNETSCGMMNPLPALMEVLRKFPDVISIVDTVSSFSAMPIPKDELGIDVMITGSQKALALPPGLALISVSERARARAALKAHRGYYFDLLEFHENHLKGMTPSTPNIPLIYALDAKLHEIEQEGIQNRYRRHASNNALVRQWIERHGFSLFPKEGYASLSLSCVANDRNIDIPRLNRILKEEFAMVIDGGYGKIKGKTFRISNMGDETQETMTELLGNLTEVLARITAA